jgi:hypothetical protein
VFALVVGVASGERAQVVVADLAQRGLIAPRSRAA